MKYKVGDRVKIKSREWYEENKIGDSIDLGGRRFNKYMASYCGREAIITDVSEGWEKGYRYAIDIDNGEYSWDDDMIECLVLDNAEKTQISEQLIKDIAEVIKSHNLGVSVSENEGKLIIEPLGKKKEDDLPIGIPVMVQYDNGNWTLRRYAGNLKTKDINNLFDSIELFTWDCIIPFDKFNPNNIEESLKYNIVK